MDGWMDRKNIDGWLNGYTFFLKIDGWTGKHRSTVGWIDKWMAGWIFKNMVGWTGKHKMVVGWI